MENDEVWKKYDKQERMPDKISKYLTEDEIEKLGTNMLNLPELSVHQTWDLCRILYNKVPLTWPLYRVEDEVRRHYNLNRKNIPVYAKVKEQE